MRSLLRPTFLTLTTLFACWGIAGCSETPEAEKGKMSGAMDKMESGKTTGAMDKMESGKMAGPMDKMESGKMAGPMDKMESGKMKPEQK